MSMGVAEVLRSQPGSLRGNPNIFDGHWPIGEQIGRKSFASAFPVRSRDAACAASASSAVTSTGALSQAMHDVTMSLPAIALAML
jgi:hypothetical protein